MNTNINTPTKITLLTGEDMLERHYVAGTTSSGKSTYLKGIAFTKHYLYFNNERQQWPHNPMTCKEFEQFYSDVIGFVLDLVMIDKIFIDWNTYKWIKPVWYSIQLNRAGQFTTECISKYMLSTALLDSQEV